MWQWNRNSPARLLHAAGAALDLEVVGLAGARGLGVEARRGRQLRLRRLVEAGLLVVERLVGRRVEAPADAAAVHVEDVEHLRAGVHDAELRRIAQVGARGRRRRIAERVAAVGLRLVVVLVEPVHERLGAVVDGARAGAVGAGELVDRRQRHAVLVVGTDGGSTCSSPISCHSSAYSRNALRRAGRADHRLPARGERLAVGAEPGRALGLDDERPEEAVRDREAVARPGPQQVGALERRVVRDVVVVRRAPAVRPAPRTG